jgi:hypothetical protein
MDQSGLLRRAARLPVLAAGTLAVVLVALWPPALLALGQGNPTAWVELGPDGASIARLITPEAVCPSITFPTGSFPMQSRGQPAQDYPLLVCEAGIPAGVTSASIDGLPLPVPSPNPRRIVVLGDTGCRLKLEHSNEAVQACNDLRAWPAEAIAHSATAWQPDLIVDVGDYLYREAPCPSARDGCEGSPWGYNWASWNADFFTPEAALLGVAPWLFVHGDHELCERAGEGWFRFLDPHPLAASCADYTEPYAVHAGALTLLMLDSANADDYQAVPAEVAVYQGQFEALNALASPNSWLLTHRPIWVFGHDGERNGAEQLFRDNPTLQTASRDRIPAGIGLVVSGHIHLFESLSFAGTRPAQLVVGNGGTALDPDITTPLAGLDVGGVSISDGVVVDQFGFMTIERGSDGWVATLRDIDGAPILDCPIQSGSVTCSPAAGPP